MRFTRACVPLLALALTATACSTVGENSTGDDDPGTPPTEVVLVTHESFVLPKKLKKKFEQASGYDLVVRASGDAGALTNKLVLTACVTDPVVRIGDRCLLGRGSGVVGHLSIEIEDDVWTGHNVYITDQNHDYADPDVPISRQVMPERPVRIGAGSWLGHGTVVLPGAQIGWHVVVGANSVVRGEIPPFCVAAGNPRAS